MTASKKLVPTWITGTIPELSPPHPYFAFGADFALEARPLNAPEYVNCYQAMEGDAAIMAIKYAAISWRGITFADNGRPVPMLKKNIDLLFEDARMIALLSELGGEIVSRSRLTDDERKN